MLIFRLFWDGFMVVGEKNLAIDLISGCVGSVVEKDAFNSKGQVKGSTPGTLLVQHFLSL